jgi:UDP-N-acetylmuramoyl-tripeptide--D-alanyl-D-alanine ligase
MMAWRLSELVRCAPGQIVGNDCAFSSVSTDSRTLEARRAVRRAQRPELRRPRLRSQRLRSAALLLRSSSGRSRRRFRRSSRPTPLGALSAFAREWRRQFHIPLIGVTGSNGKTTTKELIGSILSRQGKTLITRGNLNNHIGVPLMLLELTAEHRYAVIEMGANHIGEIAHLASLAEPTVGIVTNAGAAHLEGFGSLAGVAQGKGEMFRALPPEGVAVINADDTYAAQWRDSSAADRVLTFGFEQPADFMAHKVRSQSDASGFRTDFELVTPYGSRPATLALGGLHNLRNALGALPPRAQSASSSTRSSRVWPR